MEVEIANVQGRIREHEDQELVLMEGVEKARAHVVERRKELQAEEEAVGLDVAELDQRMARIQEEVNALEAER